MHRDATLSLRPSAPGALTETAQTGSLSAPTACSSLVVETTVLRSCAAVLLCLSGLGLQCALHFVSRRIAEWAAYFVAAFFYLLSFSLQSCCFYNAAY